MANNLTIQFGTALPSNTVFSSLRQEVTRRMTNTSSDIAWDTRLKILEKIIIDLLVVDIDLHT